MDPLELPRDTEDFRTGAHRGKHDSPTQDTVKLQEPNHTAAVDFAKPCNEPISSPDILTHSLNRGRK